MSKRRELLTGFASRWLLMDGLLPCEGRSLPLGQLRGISPHAGDRRSPPCLASPHLPTGATHPRATGSRGPRQATGGPLGRMCRKAWGCTPAAWGVRTRPGGACATLGVPAFGVWLGILRPRKGLTPGGADKAWLQALALPISPQGTGPPLRQGEGKAAPRTPGHWAGAGFQSSLLTRTWRGAAPR